MARLDKQTNVRLPQELKEWLLERAGRNCRSLTSELVVLLQDCRRADQRRRTKGEAPVIGPTEASMKPTPSKV